MAGFEFESMETWRARFPLRLSFSHHLASRDEVETVIVAVTASAGATGFGQALPRSYLTGESVESVLSDLADRWWPALREIRFDAAAGFAQAMAALAPLHREADRLGKTASYAAAEMAALDAFARARRIAALPARFPKNAAALPLVGVVPACSPRKAAWLARILHWLGYRRFKVKVGRDADADAGRLEAVRRVAGARAWLAADANQAWTLGEAEARVPALRRFGVAVVEEPLTSEDIPKADFAALENRWGVELMADESLCTLADARRLLAGGGPSWWNLRLGKNGGLLGVGALAALARECGARIYGGVLVGETSVMAAAGRAALFAAGAECLEYGFPRFFLKGDPFRGGPGGFRGMAVPPNPSAPGFGVRLIRKRLAKRGTLMWRGGGGAN